MGGSPGWLAQVNEDPTSWLLDESTPAVRAAALQRLTGRPSDHPEVMEARARAMDTDPIRGILAAQHPDGWWERRGPGYLPKYRSTVWNVIFLEQLGADPEDERIQAAARYVLSNTATKTGGFGSSSRDKEAPPPPSSVVHCLNGNLTRALIGFGHLDHPTVTAAIQWSARAITGEDVERWYASSTPGPGFACAANDGFPCAWGAIKEMRALTAIPSRRRSRLVRRALETGTDFLLSRDPAAADYPMGYGNTKPSGSWFKLGFPSGYVADVLQNLEVLAAVGKAKDPLLDHAYEWLIDQQNADGRWSNRYAYHGKTTVDIDEPGAPSKWVTLRACSVLAARFGG